MDSSSPTRIQSMVLTRGDGATISFLPSHREFVRNPGGARRANTWEVRGLAIEFGPISPPTTSGMGNPTRRR